MIYGREIQPSYNSFLDIGTIDSIDGGAGNDALEGGYGNDLIFGGTGHDLIAGNLGNDRLKGGAGHDTFIYKTVEKSAAEASISNIDRIVDFESGIDKLEILGAIDTDFRISNIAGGVFIDGTGNNDLYVYGLTTNNFANNVTIYESTFGFKS